MLWEVYFENDSKGDDDMNIRWLKSMTLAGALITLLSGCSFYARLGAVKKPDLTNAAANTENRASASAPQSGQDQLVFAHNRNIR